MLGQGARSILLPIVLLVALVVGGCSSSGGSGSRPSASSSSEETMTAVQAPPESVPDAIVNGITIPPLSSIWFSKSSGSFHTARPTIEPNEVIAIPVSGSVRITVDSPVVPAQVLVREFTGYSSHLTRCRCVWCFLGSYPRFCCGGGMSCCIIFTGALE